MEGGTPSKKQSNDSIKQQKANMLQAQMLIANTFKQL